MSRLQKNFCNGVFHWGIFSLSNVQKISPSGGCLSRLVNKEVQEGKTPENMIFPAAFEACKQSVSNYLNANRKYLGQMDLNLQSPLVWDFYKNTLEKLARYGAAIVRLDAFAYAPKTVGKKNFLNEPDTWELLDKIKEMADSFQLKLLPEIHAGYEEKTYETIAQKGFMTYDFFLPGLIIDALESGDGQALAKWANEIRKKRTQGGKSYKSDERTGGSSPGKRSGKKAAGAFEIQKFFPCIFLYIRHAGGREK